MQTNEYRVSEETVGRVIEFLQAYSVEGGGQVSRSLNDLAANLGISSATFHRAVQVLKNRGVITVIPAKVPGLPQTIKLEYREKEEQESLSSLLLRVKSLLSELESRIIEVEQENQILRNQLKYHQEFESRIVSRSNLHNGQTLIVIDSGS
jgi:DNA-binding Lrp family transcriptional regulator